MIFCQCPEMGSKWVKVVGAGAQKWVKMGQNPLSNPLWTNFRPLTKTHFWPWWTFRIFLIFFSARGGERRSPRRREGGVAIFYRKSRGEGGGLNIFFLGAEMSTEWPTLGGWILFSSKKGPEAALTQHICRSLSLENLSLPWCLVRLAEEAWGSGGTAGWCGGKGMVAEDNPELRLCARRRGDLAASTAGACTRQSRISKAQTSPPRAEMGLTFARPQLGPFLSWNSCVHGFWGEISSTISKVLTDRQVLFKHKSDR